MGMTSKPRYINRLLAAIEREKKVLMNFLSPSMYRETEITEINQSTLLQVLFLL